MAKVKERKSHKRAERLKAKRLSKPKGQSKKRRASVNVLGKPSPRSAVLADHAVLQQENVRLEGEMIRARAVLREIVKATDGSRWKDARVAGELAQNFLDGAQ